MKNSQAKVVLAYSGGLDTTVILHWLKAKGLDVVAFLADIGQRTEDLAAIGARAMHHGASSFVVKELKNELLGEFFLPCLWAHARYEDRYLMGTSIARPLIARAQVEAAKEAGATLLAHGATGKGNDQVRFELTYQALAPELGILPVWRDPEFIQLFSSGRKSLLAYAEKHGLSVKASAAKPWSSDDNLLHISYEAGLLEDPWLGAPKDLFERLVHPVDAPDQPERVIVHWSAGTPVAVSSVAGNDEPGEVLAEGLLPVFDFLDKKAAAHGIGAEGMVESRYVGMKSRGEYHAPGHTLLFKAHQDLEALCLTGSLLQEKARRMPDFAQAVYNGYWFDPAADAMRAFFASTQARVSGQTRLLLYKGNVITEGRRSPYSLYDAAVATMDGETPAYSQTDASGFIRLHALPLRLSARSPSGDPSKL